MVKAGYSAESLRRKHLEKEGYLVFRTSGSYGPIDLMAIKKEYVLGCPEQEVFRYIIRLEQVKELTGRTTFHFDDMARSELLRCIEIENKFNIPIFWVFHIKGEREFKIFNVQQLINKIEGKHIRLV